MKDIIYREDAIKLLEQQKEEDSKGYAGNFHRVIVDRDIRVIKHMPSAERTEIVRCKDCKRYDGKPCGLVNFYNTDNDYCSRYEGKG